MRGPSVQANREVKVLTLLSDVAPASWAMVGAHTPAFVDGRSLAPWLVDKIDASPARKRVLLEFWPRTGFLVDEREEPLHSVIQVHEYSVLRSERYLYVEYQYPNGGTETELYDLKRDPFELENIAAKVNIWLLTSLETKLRELEACQAAFCRAIEEEAL